MKYWPTSPLIIIKKGTYHGTDLSGSAATMRDIDNPRGGYYLLDGPKAGYVLTLNTSAERIDEWQTAVAVPAQKGHPPAFHTGGHHQKNYEQNENV